tara:strand:- start:103 stop:360 length:258 start_codon:yes stop_codon:yes gene_type:complete
MQRRAQAGLEYLMTYGWALILVTAVIGSLVLLGEDSINSSSCPNLPSFICKGAVVEGNELIMILQNSAGQKITINPGTGIAIGGA